MACLLENHDAGTSVLGRDDLPPSSCGGQAVSPGRLAGQSLGEGGSRALRVNPGRSARENCRETCAGARERDGVHAVLKELRPTLALAFPIVVGQVSQMLIGLTDNAFIGRVGTAELAAAAFTHGVFGVFYVVSIGLLLGAGVYAARDYGAGDEAGCAAWLRHGRALAFGIGLLAFGALALLSTQLHRFGQPPEVLAVVRPFFLLMSASLVPVLVFQVQRQFAESFGRPWVPMMIILADVVLNALLNWILVFGHLGAPRLGLVGSGLATLIARIAAVIAVAWWLKRSPHFAMVRAAPWRGWEAGRLRELLKIGIPAGGMLLFEAGAFGMAALMMGWLGTVPLAAHQIALGCASLTFMVPLGLSIAVSLRLSKASGERRTAALRPIGFGALGMGLAFMAGCAVVFVVAGRVVTGSFTPIAEVADLAARLLVVAAIFQMFDGGQVISAGCLRGLTDVRVPIAITFVAYWVIALPSGYLLAFKTPLGPRGVWAGLAIGLALAAVALAWRFHLRTAASAAR